MKISQRMLSTGVIALVFFVLTSLSASAAAEAILIVNSTGDGADVNAGDGLCANSQGKCTLRAAIQESNVHGTPYHKIGFSIPGPGPYTISPKSALPVLQLAQTIDGTTQPGFAGTPIVELAGLDAGQHTNGLVVKNYGSDSIIRGLVINRFGGNGIAVRDGSISIAGNFIGTDVTGTQAMGNGKAGISILGTLGGSGYVAAGSFIGGPTPADRNVISGNRGDGILIKYTLDAFQQTVIRGNYIGTDMTGSSPVGNLNGVSIYNAKDPGCEICIAVIVEIGGKAAGDGNIISGNTKAGIHIQDSTNIRIAGNSIGTDAGGLVAEPNQTNGLELEKGTQSVVIGGKSLAQRNIISGNSQYGIAMMDPGTKQNKVQGNYIGANAQQSALANLGGIYVSSAHQNSLGGSDMKAGNLIAFNKLFGVGIGANYQDSSAVGNSVRKNSIFANGTGGIDLGSDLSTANDVGDGDTGPNLLQNFPVISSASSVTHIIHFTLNSTPNTLFHLDFYTSSSCSSGVQRYVGTADVTTDSTGNIAHIFSDPALTAGAFLSATATDPNGNTSEFSACATAS